MATKAIKIDSLAKQIALFAVALVCLLGVWFVAKWCAANAIASHTIYREVAELAESWAPNDPQTHYTTAVLLEKSFSSEDLQKAISEYEQATALSPNDYRTWHELGKARERRGDRAGAEVALLKAQQLAPNYSEISWTLGNILLRENKTAEAFAQMSRAAEGNKDFVEATVATAWQVFDGDLEQIRKALGNSATVSASFVAFLAREKRFDDAVKIWNSLPAEKRDTVFKQTGDVLFEQLIAAGKYRAAVQTLTQAGDTSAGKNFTVGEIFNGGFEANVKMEKAQIFDWQIGDGSQPVVALDDSQKHGGSRSLTVVFNSPMGHDFRSVAQIVAIEPNNKYAFEIFYKSELKTSAAIYWEIAEMPSGKILAQTPPFAAVSSEWAESRVEFAAPQGAEAIAVRLAREPCKSSLCPISGRIWFDDLTLVKIQN